jgi:hypothetical protein
MIKASLGVFFFESSSALDVVTVRIVFFDALVLDIGYISSANEISFLSLVVSSRPESPPPYHPLKPRFQFIFFPPKNSTLKIMRRLFLLAILILDGFCYSGTSDGI